MRKMKLAILGCGSISGKYIQCAKEQYSDIMEIVACVDINTDRARECAEKYKIPKVYSLDEMLNDNDVELVVNLTIPKVHAELTIACLESGKHVYSEKPLAISREEGKKIIDTSKRLGLRVGCAPDTFMGSAIQTAKKLIEDGWIGEPIGASSIMVSPTRGNENWHPDPEFFYQKGAGPMFDMGPYYFNAFINLIGPIESVNAQSRITFPERLIVTQPKYGQKIKVEVPTYISGIFQFKNGAIGSIMTTFDVWNTKQPFIEIYGEDGTLVLPDPNQFTGSVYMSRFKFGDTEWHEVPTLIEYDNNGRSAGVADMIAAIYNNYPHRASGEMGYHVLDIINAFDDAAQTGIKQVLKSTCDKPLGLWKNY
ncbi:MAG TPA: oxidoreductase [Clostridiales bacterium]|nr:Gfo/Idh/MocA family oxidoreductase [Clostridia bacterium]HCS74019.1 oxidoreductase [Clostridiales bacterium]